MYLKRLVAIVLVLAMAVFVFAGCGKEEKPADNNQPVEQTEQGSSGEQNDAQKTVELSWMSASNVPPEGGYSDKYLEQKFNVKLNSIQVEGDYKQKKGIKLISGEISDAIWEPDPSDVQLDAQQGLLMEVPVETIKKYAPKYVEALNKYAPHAWLYSNVGGKNYGIPTFNAMYDTCYLGFWRQDWLENVGITKVPETLEEFEEAFRRFRNNDPDKNNKKDTYGLTTNMATWWTTFTEIFGAYGISPFTWMLKDGKVVYGATTPEMKSALELLAKWYKEELVDPEFLTDPGPGQKFSNGKLGYEFPDGNPPFNIDEKNGDKALINILRKLTPEAKLAVAQPPKGPGGQHTFNWGTGGNIWAFSKDMANEPEKVKRFLQMLEAIYTDEEVAVNFAIGKQGTHWDYKVSGDKTSGIKALPPYDDPNQAAKEVTFKWMHAGGIQGQIPDITMKYMDKGQLDFRQKYQEPITTIKDIFGKADVLPSSSKYMADLQKLTTETIAQIITGEKPISYFDEFVTQWKARGGELLEMEANKMYGEMQSIIDKAQ